MYFIYLKKGKQWKVLLKVLKKEMSWPILTSLIYLYFCLIMLTKETGKCITKYIVQIVCFWKVLYCIWNEAFKTFRFNPSLTRFNTNIALIIYELQAFNSYSFCFHRLKSYLQTNINIRIIFYKKTLSIWILFYIIYFSSYHFFCYNRRVYLGRYYVLYIFTP